MIKSCKKAFDSHDIPWYSCISACIKSILSFKVFSVDWLWDLFGHWLSYGRFYLERTQSKF